MIHSDIFFAVVFITLLVLLLLAGVIITFFISGRQKIRQRIELAETKLVFEKELRTVESEVTESVMSQLSQELHDNIGQLLTALHIQVENQKLDHPHLAESFEPAENYITEINAQLRMLSRTLNNDFLGTVGLLGALQLEVKRLQSLKRFVIHFESMEGKSNLEKNQELMVFRIFQEIIQNALRHAQAKNLYISLSNNDQQFKLTIKDDGKGFDKDVVFRSAKASGLLNIQKRAKLAGIDVDINSSPGSGTLFFMKKISTLA